MDTKDHEMRGMENHPVGDKSTRQAFIKSSILITVPATLTALAAAYAMTPSPTGLNFDMSWSLKWIFLSFLPYAAVCLVILNNRLNEGSHNPLAGAESESLMIHCRVMQNTLEQWVWFSICVLTLTTALKASEFKIVPILSVGFVIARLAYWRGYFTQGTLGRRHGVQMTFTINIGLLVGTCLLLLLR